MSVKVLARNIQIGYLEESLLKGLLIRVLAGFRETNIELATLGTISTPRIEEMEEGTVPGSKAT